MTCFRCMQALGFVAATAAIGMAATPPTDLTVVVPACSVEHGELGDYLRMDGSLALTAEEGRPVVPYLVKRCTIPPGYRVIDVTLTSSSRAEVDTGLRLPLFVNGYLPPHNVEMKPGMYPRDTFAWGTFRNPDGTSTLSITVYPFRHNPATRKSELFREFQFGIKSVEARVAIARIWLDEAVLEPDADARAAVVMENSGQPQDVTISAGLQSMAGKPLGGSRPGSRHSVERTDSSAVSVPTKGVPAGPCYLVISLTDQNGAPLDQNKRLLRIGSPSLEFTSLTAEPRTFKLGNRLRIATTIRNSGTGAARGTANIYVMDGDSVLQSFEHNVPELRPGAERTWSDTWSTARATKGVMYQVEGNLRGDGLAVLGDPVVVSTNRMPEPVLSWTPDSAKADSELQFDAGRSKDADGSIAEYSWTFGDGSDDKGEKVRHRYRLPGEYRVVLKVKDNEGGVGTAEKTITVVE